MLTFLEGPVVHPDHEDLLAEASAVSQVAEVIRLYHDAAATFIPPKGAVWRDIAADPSGEHEVICHNDLAPWNLVATSTGWAFIDWDLAAPGRRYWDLAWAFHTLVGMWPGVPDLDVTRRFAACCAGYGVPQNDWAALLRLIEQRTRWEVERIEAGAERGDAPFVALHQEGHASVWQEASEHVARRQHVWLAILENDNGRR